MVTPLPKRNLKPKFGYLFMQKKRGSFAPKRKLMLPIEKKLFQEEWLIMIIGPHNIGISILKLL
jgi:hypothetical protein